VAEVGLDEITDGLYALPPGAFTQARDEEVARARNAGQRADATELAKLRRPTVSAWLVNVVALRRPDLVGNVLDVAARMREAAGAAQLRELSRRRREEIDAVFAAARELAAEAAAPAPTPQQLSEVESTLTAAMADDEAAAMVRAGRLLKPLAYGGFGGLGELGGAVVPATGAAPAAKKQAPRRARVLADDERPEPAVADEQAREAERHRQDVAAAQDRVEAAQASLQRASAAEADTAENLERIESQIEELQRQYAEAERAGRAARQARREAERELAAAQRRLTTVEGR
jgi:chromosome segregation ATPase